MSAVSLELARHKHDRLLRRLLAAFPVALGLAGCEAPVRRPEVPVPTPTLRLLESKPLEMPAACIAHGSFIVAFTVESNGHPGNIRPPVAPPCVQQALTAWVASFRYAPVAQPVPAAVEWLLVDAGKGS